VINNTIDSAVPTDSLDSESSTETKMFHQLNETDDLKN